MKFSKESFSKFFKEVSSNDINKRNEEGETILHQAVEISDYTTVRLLIKKGAEVNARDKNGYTPLHCAVFAKSLENVKVLLREGGEVNAAQYVTGCTPLHSACKMGGAGVEIIKELVLVEKGVNVNAADVGGYTALHLAVTEKRLEIVRELIKSGAEVNAEEYGNKCTPLHLGCMVCGKEIVEELVKAGGEIEQEDECGMTAIDYAKNSKEVTEVLKKEMDRIEKLFMRG